MRPIVIYGSGLNGSKVYQWLRYIGLENDILAFCDRASERIGTEIVGIPVCSYENHGRHFSCDTGGRILDRYNKHMIPIVSGRCAD